MWTRVRLVWAKLTTGLSAGWTDLTDVLRWIGGCISCKSLNKTHAEVIWTAAMLTSLAGGLPKYWMFTGVNLFRFLSAKRSILAPLLYQMCWWLLFFSLMWTTTYEISWQSKKFACPVFPFGKQAFGIHVNFRNLGGRWRGGVGGYASFSLAIRVEQQFLWPIGFGVRQPLHLICYAPRQSYW